jgi:hypothetical protein
LGGRWVHRNGRAAGKPAFGWNRQRAGRAVSVSAGRAGRTGVSRPDSILIAIQIDVVSKATATRTVAITTPNGVLAVLAGRRQSPLLCDHPGKTQPTSAARRRHPSDG